MKKGVLAVAVLAIVGTAIVGFKFSEPKVESMDVEYIVECSDCDIIYRDQTGESITVKGTDTPWNYSFTGEDGQFIYVAATNPDGSPVVVKIKRGGELLASDKSEIKFLSARAGHIL